MKFLDLKHMYDLRTKMKLKFGLSESEYVSDVGQATSVLEKKILASRSHVISEGTSCPQPPYPPFDLLGLWRDWRASLLHLPFHNITRCPSNFYD